MAGWKIMELSKLNKKYNFNANAVCHVGAWRAKEISSYREEFGNVSQSRSGCHYFVIHICEA